MQVSNFRKGCLLLLLCLPGWATAGLHPFFDESLKEITGARNGQPFLLVLWSIDCPPCLKELKHIGQLYSEFTPGSLVLVSTDGADYAEEAQQILAHNGLTDAESWLFSGSFPERLRYRIDPNWYGELPRAYFYDAKHNRIGKSGALSLELLKQFIAGSKHIE